MIAAMNFLYKVGSPMETKKQTRQTSGKTKELILVVAREIAAEKGVGQLTLEAVADRAGISKGGLLYHFPGKKELIIALMDSYVSHLSAELESATEPFKGHPQALVLGFIHWYKKFNGIAATNRTWGAAVFAVQSFDPQLMEPLHNWYRQLFEKIRNSGPASLDTATAIMAIEGLFMLSLYNLDQLTTEEKSRIIQHIEDRLLMRELNPKNSIE